MSPTAFVAKWLGSNFGEKQASQEMFLDICGVLGHPTPGDYGDKDAFTFEKPVPGGVPDAYLEGRFGWEFKGDDDDLDGAMNQLLRYQVHLKTPPLLIVSSFNTIRIRTNFPGMETVLYERPYRQRLKYADIKALADALVSPPRSWTTERLWEAYRRLDTSKVLGSGQRTLADIVSVVRYAIGGADELTPFADGVREHFRGWLAMQETAGRAFTQEQVRWLGAIRDHIAGSVSMELSDFQYAPFNQQGGLGKAYELFGDELGGLLEELNEALVG